MCTLYMYTTLEVEDLSPSKVNTIICWHWYIYIYDVCVNTVLQLHEFYQAYRFKIKLYLGVG